MRIFKRILSTIRADLEREAAHRWLVRLLDADEATLRELGMTRADIRMAFLLNQGSEEDGPIARG